MTQRIDFTTFRLGYSSHTTRDDGMCAAEAVAYLAGEKHSDRPQCMCPSFGMIRDYNDRCGKGPAADDRRTRVLGPLLPLLVGTRSTHQVEWQRRYLAADWSIRNALPRLLRLTPGHEGVADALEAMPKIVDSHTLASASPTIVRARDAAYAKRAAAIAGLPKTATATATAAATVAAVAAVDTAVAAVDTAVAAVDTAVVFRRMFDAALRARKATGSWSDAYCAARAIADKNVDAIAPEGSALRALRDQHDEEFADLIRRMVAIREAA